MATIWFAAVLFFRSRRMLAKEAKNRISSLGSTSGKEKANRARGDEEEGESVVMGVWRGG